MLFKTLYFKHNNPEIRFYIILCNVNLHRIILVNRLKERSILLKKYSVPPLDF